VSKIQYEQTGRGQNFFLGRSTQFCCRKTNNRNLRSAVSQQIFIKFL